MTEQRGRAVAHAIAQELLGQRAEVDVGPAGVDVVEVGVLLTDPTGFAGMNDEYARWFPNEPPTRYVAKLGVEIPGVLVSIRMTAYIG